MRSDNSLWFKFIFPWWLIAVVWIFVSSQTPYAEILTLNVMVLGGEVFGRWLGHEVRAPMNGICVLIKDA